MNISELKQLVQGMDDYRSYSATAAGKARGMSYTNGPQSQEQAAKRDMYAVRADALSEKIRAEVGGSTYREVINFASSDDEKVEDVVRRRKANEEAWLKENYA